MKKAVTASMAALLAAAFLSGCQPSGPPASRTESAVSGSAASTVALPTGESTTTEEVSAVSQTQASTAARPTSRPSSSAASSSQPAQTAATTAAASQGHLSKGDATVEPVRSLEEILAGLSSDDQRCDRYDLENT